MDAIVPHIHSHFAPHRVGRWNLHAQYCTRLFDQWVGTMATWQHGDNAMNVRTAEIGHFGRLRTRTAAVAAYYCSTRAQDTHE